MNKIIDYRNWKTELGTIPFEEIKLEEILPAIEEGMRIEAEEVKEIKSNPATPTFENTIEAFEFTGKLLGLAERILNILMSVKTSEELIKINKIAKEKITKHNLLIGMDKDLFKRVEYVYLRKESFKLTVEEKRLLEMTYDSFIDSGVGLEGEKRDEFKKVEEDLVSLQNMFYENLLAEESEYSYLIEKEEDLDGLTEATISVLRKNAEKAGKQGWLITGEKNILATEIYPNLESRKIRKKLYEDMCLECANPGKNDNREIVVKITNLSLKKANILGYERFSDYSLRHTMAKSTLNVMNFINELKEKAYPYAKNDILELSEYAKSLEGKDFELAPWDLKFYFEKLREKKYGFNKEDVKPFFEFSNVRDTSFNLYSKLFSVHFEKVDYIQTWNSDVEVYKVLDEFKKHLGFVYVDPYSRKGEKSSGAFMDEIITGEDNKSSRVRPLVLLATNIQKPTDEYPALLSMSEAMTFLHELGHVMHAIFSKTTYASLFGISVSRDFVELPSQIMENFFYEKNLFLDYCRHYKTGEKFREELYEKIISEKKFFAGYYTIRQLSFCLLDMGYYTKTSEFEKEVDIVSFESEKNKEVNLFPNINTKSFMASSFPHIFIWDYSAGYYSYKWSEVLDADAFFFMKKNNFKKEVMDGFRREVLEKGGVEPADAIYKKWRGKAASVDAMLKRDGLA